MFVLLRSKADRGLRKPDGATLEAVVARQEPTMVRRSGVEIDVRVALKAVLRLF